MSKERIKISEDLYDIMPSDYQDLVKSATYGKEDRGWKDIGNSKELIEQHSLCAGCPESMAFRYILASLPNPGRHRHGRLHRLHQPGVPDGGRSQHPLALRQPKRHRLRLEARPERPLPRPDRRTWSCSPATAPPSTSAST